MAQRLAGGRQKRRFGADNHTESRFPVKPRIGFRYAGRSLGRRLRFGPVGGISGTGQR